MSKVPTYIIKLLVVLIFVFLIVDNTYSQERRKSRDQQQEIKSSDFGKSHSVGISLLGLGLAGINSKLILFNESQLEVDISYAPFVAGSELIDATRWNKGVTFAGGFNLAVGKKDKWWNQKVIKHYVSLKGGYWLSDYQNYFFAGPTWRRESFKYRNRSRSFAFDLGLIYLMATEETRFRDPSLVTLFFRMDFNFFKK